MMVGGAAGDGVEKETEEEEMKDVLVNVLEKVMSHGRL